MSVWDAKVKKQSGLPSFVISEDLAVKIREAANNAKPDPKFIEVYRYRPLTFEELHTLYD